MRATLPSVRSRERTFEAQRANHEPADGLFAQRTGTPANHASRRAVPNDASETTHSAIDALGAACGLRRYPGPMCRTVIQDYSVDVDNEPVTFEHC